LQTRLKKGEKEMTFADKFDYIVVNDEISTSSTKATNLIKTFLNPDKNKATN
jgi:guanylate kinase